MKRSFAIKAAKWVASTIALFAALLLANYYTDSFRYNVFKCEFYGLDWHYVRRGVMFDAECDRP